MIIFIDESGDAGFKLNKGSSAVFVISLVIFDDELDAEEAAIAIKKLRRKLKKSDNFEFKFNKLKKQFRQEFLLTVSKSNFRIRSIVFRKELLYSSQLRSNKNSFYSYAIKLLLKHDHGTIKNAKIRIDGLGERSFRKGFTAYLRKELNTKEKQVIDKLQFVDSRTNVLIQLADMVAGAIRMSYSSNRTDSDLYKLLIESKIQNIWEFK